VVEALLGSGDRHVSAEEIIATVQRRRPEVAESSIYRTLSALEGLALVTHVHLGHGPATFHLGADAHRHLVCRRCQAIVDIPADSMAAFAADIERRYGFAITDEHFALMGECRVCRRPGG
jgi:Fur family ferric uptake transcriptional regulator